MSAKEKNLNRYISEGKPRYIKHEGKRIYLSKKKITELQEKQKSHEGGIIPLLALLPAILGGIGAAAGVGTMGAKIAQTVSAKKHEKTMEDLEKQKLETMKGVASGTGVEGEGLLVDLATKVENKTQEIPNEVIKWIKKRFNISQEKEGNGLILRPIS